MKLKEWINQIKEGIKTKLLFKLSRDGETIAKFHELCDNIKDNLIIIKAENNTIFGGYCTWNWAKDGSDITVNQFIYIHIIDYYYYYYNFIYNKGK